MEKGEKSEPKLQKRALPGHRLKAMREAVGLSLLRFAEALSDAALGLDSISGTLVGHWESGNKPVARGWDEYVVRVLHDHGLRLAGASPGDGKVRVSLKDLVAAATNPHASEALWQSLWRGAWLERESKCYPVHGFFDWVRSALPEVPDWQDPSRHEPRPAREPVAGGQEVVIHPGMLYRVEGRSIRAIGPAAVSDNDLPNPSPEPIEEFRLPPGGRTFAWYGNQELSRISLEKPETA